MTAQEPDYIRFKPRGRREELLTNPLDEWFCTQGIGPRLLDEHGMCTSNWRGYVATFLVHRGHLWVERVDATGDAVVGARPRERRIFSEADGEGEESADVLEIDVESEASFRERAAQLRQEMRPFDLAGIFPREGDSFVRDRAGRVRADWYSGLLRVPDGELLDYVHMGYESLYASERFIAIQAGVVVDDFSTRGSTHDA